MGDGIFVQIMFGYRAVKCSLEDIEELVNRDSYWRKEEAVIAIRSLSEILGENLKYVPPSHIKLLLVDDSYLLIGSLNWLYNSGRSAQKEISCLITNPETIQYVKEGFWKRGCCAARKRAYGKLTLHLNNRRRADCLSFQQEGILCGPTRNVHPKTGKKN